MRSALSLGAPGLYSAPARPARRLAGERMDVAAFVGVAPRGPAMAPGTVESCADFAAMRAALLSRRRSVPVAVESWAAYRALFGGYEGPGRLPYAVASFFENGGARAYVVRIVHRGGAPEDGVAYHDLTGVTSSGAAPRIRARNEGAWGNGLRLRLGHGLRPLRIDAAASGATRLVLPDRQDLAAGSLLRLRRRDPAAPAGNFDALRFADRLTRVGAAGGPARLWEVALDGPALPAAPTEAEVVTATLEIWDIASAAREAFSGLGLSYRHPRWLARVLFEESGLVLPEAPWLETELTPDEIQPLDQGLARMPGAFGGGDDRYEEIDPEDFFDPDWILGQDAPGDGVHALALLPDLSLLAVPDLYLPEPLVPRPDLPEPAPLSRAEFGPCVTPARPALGPLDAPEPALPKLLLDPQDATDRARILELQRRLAAFAGDVREFVALLDVPPGLTERQTLDWRAALAGAYATAYHPWLRVSVLEDARDALTLLPPSAVAAGIVARQERRFGVPHGPANALAEAVVAAAQPVTQAEADRFHPLGLNVFAQERDGVWLTAARTLSDDPSLRQLSVVRLMTLLRRTLRRQMQWAVFEPNGPALRADLRHQILLLLRGLFRLGAFRGTREEEAFFVRCDAVLNPQASLDQGRLVAEIGVAPAEPLEFIVIRLERSADGTLSVEEA